MPEESIDIGDLDTKLTELGRLIEQTQIEDPAYRPARVLKRNLGTEPQTPDDIFTDKIDLALQHQRIGWLLLKRGQINPDSLSERMLTAISGDLEIARLHFSTAKEFRGRVPSERLKY